jgi:hypothetical protein
MSFSLCHQGLPGKAQQRYTEEKNSLFSFPWMPEAYSLLVPGIHSSDPDLDHARFTLIPIRITMKSNSEGANQQKSISVLTATECNKLVQAN